MTGLQLIEVVAAFIEIYIIYSIAIRSFGNKHKKVVMQKIYLSTVFTAIILLLSSYSLFSYPLILIKILLITVTTLFICDCTSLQALSLSSFCVMCIYILGFITMTLMGVILEREDYGFMIMNGFGKERLYYLVLVNTILIISYFCFKKIFKNRFINLGYLKFLLIISMIVFLDSSILVRKTLSSIDGELADRWFILMLFLNVTFAVYYIYSKIKIEKRSQNLILIRNKMLEERYDQLNESYKLNAKNYHDFNNHINILYQLLYSNEYNEAIIYIENINSSIKNIGNSIWTGINSVDFLLNSKKEEADKLGIRMDISTELFNEINIQNNDMCAILANLLDNAIEANQKVDDNRWITVKMKKINDMFMIKIENNNSLEPQVNNNIFISSKVNKNISGWGLQSVKSLTDKYGGSIQYDFSNQYFSITIVFF